MRGDLNPSPHGRNMGGIHGPDDSFAKVLIVGKDLYFVWLKLARREFLMWSNA